MRTSQPSDLTFTSIDGRNSLDVAECIAWLATTEALWPGATLQQVLHALSGERFFLAPARQACRKGKRDILEGEQEWEEGKVLSSLQLESVVVVWDPETWGSS